MKFLAVALLLVAHAALAQTAPEGTSPAASTPASLGEAQRLTNRGKPADALTMLDALAARNAGVAGISRARGDALYALARLPEADKAYAKALTQDANDRAAAQMRGLTLYRLGRPAEAIPLLTGAGTQEPGMRADPSYVLALCYLDTRRYDDARHAFATQYGFPPDSAPAYLIAARMLFRREYVPVAQASVRKALELDPQLPLAHQLLGEIALAGNHLPEATAEFELERTRNPLNGAIYDRLGDAYSRSGDFAKADQALQRAVLLEPNVTGPYILLGKVALKRGDAVGAVTYLERASTMDPGNYMTHSLLGQAYRAEGRAAEAARETAAGQRIQTASEPKLESVQ